MTNEAVLANRTPPSYDESPSTHRLAGIAAALGAVAIWGVTFVPGKLALAEIGPITLAVLRFSIALAVLLPTLATPPSKRYQLANVPWPRLAALGFTGVALYFGLQNLGLARTTATDAGLISGCVPAVTATLSALLLKERLGRIRLVGIAGSMAGAAVMILSANPTGRGNLVGDLFMLAGTLAWAAYTIMNKDLGRKLPDSVLLVATMAFGVIFLLPAAALEVAFSGLPALSLSAWFYVLFLGLAGSAGAFFCWNAALRHLDATEASTYINLVPLVSVASAALLLGERLTLPQVLGGALVIGGVYLAGREQQLPAPAPSSHFQQRFPCEHRPDSAES